jgi:dynein light intermediate chain 1, cytosolic
VKLSNRYAYGYGYVTLYTPPRQGAGLLGGEAEEAVSLEVHTVPDPEPVYDGTLRRLLQPPKKTNQQNEEDDVGFAAGEGIGEGTEEEVRPAICLLLSWKEPWRFLGLLRRWLQLLARALLPPDSPQEDPVEVLREHRLTLTVIVQHVEAQESLEREGYQEETFEYISQCIRTCILPLSAALVYTSSNPPPQQPGSALSELQKVVFTSLALDLAPLSPSPAKGMTPAKREDLAPKHNFVDRMAIVVPAGWDSAGKIRLSSENFSPESVLEGWQIDLSTPWLSSTTTTGNEAPDVVEHADLQAKGGAERVEPEAEVYATSDAGSEDPDLAARPLSPSKQSLSAIATYEQAIVDPNAHKAPKPPQIEVTTKPTQQFLAEMRAHLDELKKSDEARGDNTASGVSSTAGSTHGGRIVGLPSGEQTGALSNLGDVSFNVGGVSYNTVSAEAAIERLKRPSQPTGLESPVAASPRMTTPRPPKREDREVNMSTPIAAKSSGKSKADEIQYDKLEEYFSSLMKKGGGGGSGASTPSKGQ